MASPDKVSGTEDGQAVVARDISDAGFQTSDLNAYLQSYLDETDLALISDAYQCAAEAHMGQRRLSGEPYISHPLAVAMILAEMHMNAVTIAAAILHDVIEDTGVGKEEIAERFGDEVADLVDGVSKLTQIGSLSRQQAQAENLRKMLLAMVEDIRVIIIKLADRLHNMRTLGAMPIEKRRRIARETLEIYAPIANRLGMNQVRTELQELSFAESYPMRYRVLSEAVRKARGNRGEIIGKIQENIEQRLEEERLVDFVVQGREKHIYSIYQKMRAKHLPFAAVFDVYAFRITVATADDCYRTLGIVHSLYKPVPGRFKDYIAIPKANGYQSLHTVLFGAYGVHLEVQIRSQNMAKVAEAGVAAHWLYKLGDSDSGPAQGHTRKWMSALLDLQKNAGNSMEFLENVKIDLFPEEVYVFSPKGKIIEMPKGSTVVDFAYAVHSDIGNTCIAARVGRQLVPLNARLSSGQTVEIITSKKAQPNPSWLNFVVTGKARSNIRHYLKHMVREESLALGRRILTKALKARGYALDDQDLLALLAEFGCSDIEALCVEVGLGNRPAPLIARRLEESKREAGRRQRPHSIKTALHRYMPSWLGGGRAQESHLSIKGTEGMVVTHARCCHPIPGDAICGFLSAGKGIVVHTRSCRNIKEYRKNPDKWVDVEWDAEAEQEYPVTIRVDARNRRGVLAAIAARIADMGVNTRDVQFGGEDGAISSLLFTIDVRSRDHLARIMRRVRALDDVVRINRKQF